MHTANIITDNNASPTGRLVKDDSYFPPYSGERYEDGRDINAVISDEDTTAYERTGPTYLGGDPDSDEQLAADEEAAIDEKNILGKKEEGIKTRGKGREVSERGGYYDPEEDEDFMSRLEAERVIRGLGIENEDRY